APAQGAGGRPGGAGAIGGLSVRGTGPGVLMMRRSPLHRAGAAVIVALLLLTAWLAVGPWLTVRGIERALERRDTAALDRYVDFPMLRANLKAQLDDRLVRAAGPDAGASMLGAFALAALGGASGTAVDTLATPTG